MCRQEQTNCRVLNICSSADCRTLLCRCQRPGHRLVEAGGTGWPSTPISADNPDYTTGDADGYAQVIALSGLFGGLFGGSPASAPSVASVRAARSTTAV